MKKREIAHLTTLKTLSNVIAEQRPYIKAEVYEHTNQLQREEFFQFFAGYRYAICRVDSESCCKRQVLNEAGLMKRSHFDIFSTPGEIQAS